MREEVLKEFFAGNIDARILAKDLRGAMVTSGGITKHPIEDMTVTFDLRPEHLTRLCDAVLAGDLKPEQLQAIGFCIVASDHFDYDTDTPEGDLIGDTVMEWSAPTVHYPLTLASGGRVFRMKLGPAKVE
jgi:hypothetical protein